MAWRGLHLSEPCRLSLSRNALSIRREGKDTVTVPLEDTGWIIVDTPQASLTSNLISACADKDVAVIFVDSKHLPNAALIPRSGYHRQLETLKLQIEASDARKNRLWQNLVQSKIRNQASVLTRTDADSARALTAMAGRVKSGDPDNVEALAAQEYWKSLFDGFVRRDESDERNGFLNFGYAIIRSLMARELAALGYEPSIGLHHRNMLNAFNLADDMFEPYRPFVDWHVAEYLRQAAGEGGATAPLDKTAKQYLAALPGTDVSLSGETMPMINAVSRTAASLRRALQNKTHQDLDLPDFVSGGGENGKG